MDAKISATTLPVLKVTLDPGDKIVAETGKFDPSLPLAFRIARLFGLRIEEIFEEEA